MCGDEARGRWRENGVERGAVRRERRAAKAYLVMVCVLYLQK